MQVPYSIYLHQTTMPVCLLPNWIKWINRLNRFVCMDIIHFTAMSNAGLQRIIKRRYSSEQS